MRSNNGILALWTCFGADPSRWKVVLVHDMANDVGLAIGGVFRESLATFVLS
jgi:hypothetical protein